MVETRTKSGEAAAASKVRLDFTAIAARLKGVELPEVDVVYAIATGGVVPGALVAYELGVPLKRLDINYRAADNSPQRPAPELLAPVDVEPFATRVMLVDDVSVSGQTMQLARAQLAGCQITTLVLKGREADFVLFPEVASCVIWPWNKA